MFKELKLFFYILAIFIFFFFSIKYYFSDDYEKHSYRKINNLDKSLIIYTEKLKELNNDTTDIIEYNDNLNTKKKKKYFFWELLKKND